MKLKLDFDEIISKNVSWLQTMKQPSGYSGPVVHYWRDCLSYIGPSLGWAYEGIITAYITLFEKTRDNLFLELATEAGDHLVNAQLKNGSFLNSNFEDNPSLARGGTPHETAACIGLMRLAKKLRDLKLNWQPYYTAAAKNLELYHIRDLYDKSAGTFLQYRYDQKKYHVPNKNATLTELLILFHEFTKDERYLEFARRSADFILSQQNQEEFRGGIYQTDKKHTKVITYYTARCVPALLNAYSVFKDKKYLKSALSAGKFIKSMELDNGGFAFGHIKSNDIWQKFIYPVWCAGSADIIRALYLLKSHKNFNIRNNLRWLLGNTNPNGSFRTSYGMNLKNDNIQNYSGKPFWRDIIPVVGWNDKALRLCSELYDKGTISISKISPFEAECKDANYYENEDVIRISGKENFSFGKEYGFSKYNCLRNIVMRLALHFDKPGKRTLREKIIDKILRF